MRTPLIDRPKSDRLFVRKGDYGGWAICEWNNLIDRWYVSLTVVDWQHALVIANARVHQQRVDEAVTVAKFGRYN